MVVQVVVLSANGESRQSRMTLAPSPETVAKLLRKTKKPEAVGVYAHEDLQFTVWGWKEGKAGTENKHELPPPIDEVLLFGDAVVSAADADGAPQDLTVEDWETFYEAAFEGFEETASDSDSDAESEAEEAEEEPAEEADAAAEVEGDAEESGDDEEEEEEDDAEEEEVAEEEEEEDADEDCYDDGDDAGGGGKRRAPRRRAIAAPEYRRMEMGLRSRVKIPAPVGKRAPRWQTAPELTAEEYVL